MSRVGGGGGPESPGKKWPRVGRTKKWPSVSTLTLLEEEEKTFSFSQVRYNEVYKTISKLKPSKS